MPALRFAGKVSNARLHTCALYLTYATALQTMEGKRPLGTTASEFAAFFDLHILPALREKHMSEDFDAQCEAFARDQLKLPPHLWHLVQLPAFISLDNATIHPWARKLMCQPRYSKAEVDALVRQQFEEDHGPMPDAFTLWPDDKPPLPKRVGADSVGQSPAANVRHHLRSQDQQSQEAQQRERDEYAAQLEREYQEDCRQFEVLNSIYLAQQAASKTAAERAGDAHWLRDCMRKLANRLKRMRVLLPQQFMPLVPVTPDLHSPVEHMVRTLKCFVRQLARDHMHSDELYDASKWQEWNDLAVRSRGSDRDANGNVVGNMHVKRSVEKQYCICQILATPAGQKLIVKYTFGDGGANDKAGKPRGGKTTRWEVIGTGGGWILIAKWT